MTDLQKTYRVTWTIEVDATSPEAAAERAIAMHHDQGSHAMVPDVADGTLEHRVAVAGLSNKTHREQLAAYTATLHTHSKLIETVVEIAWNMALAHFRPDDSHEFHNFAKDWAAEFEALYDDRVVSCEWHEDDWRERCEHFTQEKVQQAVLAGLGRILARDEPRMASAM